MSVACSKVFRLDTYQSIRPLHEAYEIARTAIVAPAKDRDARMDALISHCHELVSFSHARPEFAEAAIRVAHFAWKIVPTHIDEAIQITKALVAKTAPENPVRELAAELFFNKALTYAHADKPVRAESMLASAQVLLPSVSFEGHVLPQDTSSKLSSQELRGVQMALRYYGVDPHIVIDPLHLHIFAQQLDRLTEQPTKPSAPQVAQASGKVLEFGHGKLFRATRRINVSPA